MEHDRFAAILTPGASALVVWDVQRMLVDGIFNKDEFLVETNALIGAARTKGVPVFFTKITPLPERFESPARKFFMKMRTRKLAFTPEGMGLAVEPAAGDTVINKNTASIFVGTNFELMMRSAGLATIVFTGIATEIGIESSARDALNRGFFPVIATDAVSSFDREAHERSLANLNNMMVVLSSDEIIAAWHRA